ncbi:MAG: hypothetical protein U1D00_12045, partial [Mycobacterium sp.]|nr:hypothetical protein [Mycobacterium sp.]
DGRGYEPALTGGDARAEDGREDTLFADRYAREGLGSLSSAPPARQPASDEFPSGPLSFWGVPVQSEAPVESDIGPSAVEQEDPDAIDTAPTRVPTASEVSAVSEASAVSADREPIVAPEDEPAAAPEQEPVVGLGRDPLTDTGRHARIDIDEPLPSAPALRLPLDDPNEIPEGYPVKADTGSGLYWVPGDADYDEASAHIWFASEEMARTNGFVRGE